jgi:hypothetical protein
MSFVHLGDDHSIMTARAASAAFCSVSQDETYGKVHHRIGRFEASFELTNVQKIILTRLDEFYSDEMVDNLLRPIIEQHSGAPSIRSIDWLLTNFSKARQILITTGSGETINVFSAYKTALSFWRRRNFDAFRRKLRLVVHHRNGTLESTCAQLNLFAWAHNNGIIDYCRENSRLIEADMNEIAHRTKIHRRDRKPGERRRTELSKAPKSRVMIYSADDEIKISR